MARQVRWALLGPAGPATWDRVRGLLSAFHDEVAAALLEAERGHSVSGGLPQVPKQRLAHEAIDAEVVEPFQVVRPLPLPGEAQALHGLQPAARGFQQVAPSRAASRSTALSKSGWAAQWRA